MALTALAVTAVATSAWEFYARAQGYRPTLNDTADLWAQQREKVKSDSFVIIGDSRAWFDLDLDELEAGLGARPLQLAIPGSAAYPILADLAADESFRGTVIASLLPAMWMAPSGMPIDRSNTALERYRNWSPAQRWSHELGMLLEERVAFLKQDDLALGQLLKRIDLPNRAEAQLGPTLPPYFVASDRERRGRMIDEATQPGAFQDHIRQVWLALFKMPPPPRNFPPEKFAAMMHRAMEKRFNDTKTAVEKIQARGGKVVFVRFPVTGPLKEREDQLTPRAGVWTRILVDTQAPGIYFEDYPELASFDCPEWSHLSAADSVEFTKRLVPHLQSALAGAPSYVLRPGSGSSELTAAAAP